MAVWSLVLLFATLAFLAYKNPSTMQKYMPQWLWPGASIGINNIYAQDNESKENESESSSGPEIKIGTEGTLEAETTPKASASKPNGAVPSFSLIEDSSEERDASVHSKSAVPSFPAISSPQRASSMPSPARPISQHQPSSLMPPPARPVPPLRGPAPSQAASLRAPTTGPLPNRGPPANSQQRVSSSLAPTATATSGNSRGKILLKPGHSPMDWAALTRSPSANLSGVSTFQRVTPSQLRKMTGRKGKPAWSSWQGKVYNITPYVDFHPGGGPEIMKAAGRDGEKLFMETHPWVNWENMLGACLVGVLVPEGYHDVKEGSGESELEGLD